MATTLSMARLKEASHFNNNWSAALSADQSFEDALKPDFWSHVTRFFRVGDLIRLIPETNDYYAVLIVMETGKVWAKVRPVSYVPLSASAEGYDEIEQRAQGYIRQALSDESQIDEPHVPGLTLADLSVEWKGPAVKFAVIRKSDNARIREGFADKADAEAWAKQHVDTLAR